MQAKGIFLLVVCTCALVVFHVHSFVFIREQHTYVQIFELCNCFPCSLHQCFHGITFKGCYFIYKNKKHRKIFFRQTKGHYIVKLTGFISVVISIAFLISFSISIFNCEIWTGQGWIFILSDSCVYIISLKLY